MHPEVPTPEHVEKPTNPPCDEKVLVLLRRLRDACQELVDYHSNVLDCCECETCDRTPWTIMDLCTVWAAQYESCLYRTPTVTGELQPAEEDAIARLPVPDDGRN